MKLPPINPRTFLLMVLALFAWLLSVFAPVQADHRPIEIKMPAAKYYEELSGQGTISLSPNGKTIVYRANDALHRYPEAGHDIKLGDRIIDYVRWNHDGTQFIVGSATGTGLAGWAWLIDSQRFAVVRKLAGNIAAAWFEGASISYVQVTERGPLCIRGMFTSHLTASVVIAASTEDGKFLLARTHLHHNQGYRGNLVIFRNTRTGLRLLITVDRNEELADESCELITSNSAGQFVVTECEDAHITDLGAAFYVFPKERHSVYFGESSKGHLYFNLNSYGSLTGLYGICHTVDDQAPDGPLYTYYRYRCFHGRITLRRVAKPILIDPGDDILAYSMNVCG